MQYHHHVEESVGLLLEDYKTSGEESVFGTKVLA